MDIDFLKKLAREEKWEDIDNEIPRVCNDASNIGWAVKKGLKDRNINVRDLAASLLEKAHISDSQFQEMRPELAQLMRKDKGRYSSFRAACALAAHNPGQYRDDVLSTLRSFESDKDVSSIAKNYLKKLS